ncbi:ankyrin repeat domain-containing protein [Phaeobacter inhibens]|uniref:ankyrin repeat domain-containing protein n=1 Tax=Phaeobacter inhibens TaxID=221822 RepID=UPI0021A49088|nr:ankyrin repeat domain-containing protein [Phaeobacter inhibens]UWR63657.1 ankyrin repeat domain-containing protein [Phaeobacter inhibens]
MTKSLDQLRRDAKALRKAHHSHDTIAQQRIASQRPRKPGTQLRHADYLHVIARENGFPSWPALKFAAELLGMDLATKRQRLRRALYAGHFAIADQLLADSPALADGDFGLCLSLLRKADVLRALDQSTQHATALIGDVAPPLTILARSRWIHHAPEREADMLAIAEALLAAGADINLGAPVHDDSDHRLSPLYFAIGHADNMALGQWLLEQGANPDDGESLYHATELGHHDGLRMLLAHGAEPEGTNALLRAMDFHDVPAVQLLLDHGARVDAFDGRSVGGEAPWVVPALHQAARRMADREMITLLLDNGAALNRRFQGATPYAYARIFGNRDLAQLLAERGADTTLTPVEETLAAAAEGTLPGTVLTPEAIPEAYRDIIRQILHLPDKLDHIRRLVALGLDHDRPDSEGLTPVQVAGWEGVAEVLRYLLSLKPDLTHVNGYGGTLLSTILHGAEHCPQAAVRDHIACLELALGEGIALPRRAMALTGVAEVAEFLMDWAEQYPGQVVDGGVV